MSEFVAVVPDFVFDRKWHEADAYQMSVTMRAMLAALPKVRLGGLQVGKSYFDGRMVFAVERITPSGKQVDVTYAVTSRKDRLYAGSSTGEFTEMDEEMISMLGVTHEDIIRAAIERGLPIPPEIRRIYPKYFLEAPERFSVQRSARTAEERLHAALAQKHPPLTPALLETMIARENRHVAEYIAMRASWTDESHRFLEDVEGWIKEAQTSVEFLRWLQPHIEPGGIFYIPGSENETAEEDCAYPVRPKERPILATGDDL